MINGGKINVSNYFLLRDSLDKSLRLYEEKKADDKFVFSQCLAAKASLLKYEKRYDEALITYDDAEKYNNAYANSIDVKIKNLIDILEGKASVLYCQRKYEDVLLICNQIINCINKLPTYFTDTIRCDYSWSMLVAGKALYESGSYEEAIDYICFAIEGFSQLYNDSSSEYKVFLDDSILCGRQLFTHVRYEENAIKLKQYLVNYGYTNKSEGRIFRNDQISSTKVSDSLRLLFNSTEIPSKYRPVSRKHISKNTLDTVLLLYGYGIKESDVVALLLNPGMINAKKSGILFSKEGICSDCFVTKRLIKYDELESVTLIDNKTFAFLYKNKQYEENTFPLAKLFVSIMNGDTSIREYK
jgi:tetratricopeptide (TPR) repeat protein